jgi:hypothetical protein
MPFAITHPLNVDDNALVGRAHRWPRAAHFGSLATASSISRFISRNIALAQSPRRLCSSSACIYGLSSLGWQIANQSWPNTMQRGGEERAEARHEPQREEGRQLRSARSQAALGRMPWDVAGPPAHWIS